MAKQYVVIGLGRFGRNIALALQNIGEEILAIDNSDEIVQKLSSDLKYVVKADATSQESMEALGVKNFDVAVVSIGENVQASILISLILKDLGVPMIVTKADNELHGRALEKIGVNLVVYPEKEMAINLAKRLSMPNIIDRAPVAGIYKIYDIKVPKSFDGKTLKDLQLNRRYGITVMLINNDGQISFPSADAVLLEGEILIVLSTDEDIRGFVEDNNGNI